MWLHYATAALATLAFWQYSLRSRWLVGQPGHGGLWNYVTRLGMMSVLAAIAYAFLELGLDDHLLEAKHLIMFLALLVTVIGHIGMSVDIQRRKKAQWKHAGTARSQR